MKTEPYIYKTEEGSIYLIQNLSQGDIRKAINVCQYWDTYKINLGNIAEEYKEVILPKYVLYGISPSANLVLLENHAGTDTDYLQILTYGPDQYAAMLKLL